MTKPVKLADVAEQAQVSPATVSRALNGGTVKESARVRIQQAIEKLNYQPNLAARDLAGGRSRTIGLIVSNLENPFFFDIYRAMEAGARAQGFEVVMANTGYRPRQLAASIRMMIGRRVAGLAAIVSEMGEGILNELFAAKLPAVFFDVGIPGPGITNVKVNYRVAMEKVVAYLHGLGHMRLGFLGHHDLLAPLGERLKAVVNAVAQYESLQVRSVEGEDTLEGGRHAMNSLLDSGFAPTAVICVNDVTAVGALRSLRERGLRVPHDVSVVGFDNIKMSEFSSPALTTVHVPRDLIGKIIVDLLTAPPGRIVTQQEIVIEPDLLVRDSTGPAPIRVATI